MVLENIKANGKERILEAMKIYKKNPAFEKLLIELCPTQDFANVSMAFHIGVCVGELLGFTEGSLEEEFGEQGKLQ
jgi:hypothetical protein